jgi:DNA replication protein DnaC
MAAFFGYSRFRRFPMIEDLISSLEAENIVSETEVRTKVAIPLLQLLGFPDDKRAEEFPIYGYDGRKQLNTKFADILLFDSSNFNNYRKREDRGWVMDHSLLVVELKKPSESMDAQGQAEFYSMWTRAPFYMITNGKEIAVYKLESYYKDTLVFRCEIKELHNRWIEIYEILNWEKIRKYSERTAIENITNSYLDNYIKVTLTELRYQLNHSLDRMFSKSEDFVDFPIRLTNFVKKNNFKSESYVELLGIDESMVILSEPGGGKTYLLYMLAKELLNKYLIDNNVRIPVILSAKLWNKTYTSLVEGIYNEVKPYCDFVTISRIEEELKKGKFLVLLDGLDEVQTSYDVLIDNLIKLSKTSGVQIFVTCRKDRYHDELREAFDRCELQPLEDDQINQYAKAVLGEKGDHFTYRIGGALASLVRNPLFLFMTVQVIKFSSTGELPENRSELYKNYLLFLYRWKKSKFRKKEILSEGKIEAIFSEYALMTFRKSEDDKLFDEIILKHVSVDSLADAREELFEFGILTMKTFGPDFFHPSFNEYFLATYLSKEPEEELNKFISDKHKDETYFETFMFLAGLLREENRQSILFNYLEENNLYLYCRCLASRFDRTEEIKLNWPKTFVESYFEQIRQSYLRIIEYHFKPLKQYFHPWWSLDYGSNLDLFEIAIEGSFDPNIPAVHFNFKILEKDASEPKVNIEVFQGTPKMRLVDHEDNAFIPIISMTSNDGHYFHDLGQSDLGIDSAREVAFNAVTGRIIEILKHKLIYWAEGPALACAYVEGKLEELNSIKMIAIPEELTNLSLRSCTIEDLIKVFTKYADARGFRYPNGLVKEFPFQLLLCYLVELKNEGVNPRDYLLPPPDRKWEEIPEGKRFVWNLWSESELCKRIGLFFDFFQYSYRRIVETCFPTLKEDLYFYRIGPVKYFASIYIDESPMGGYVELSWEPVPTMADTKTHVVKLDTEPDRNYQAIEDEFKKLRGQLFALGRRNDQISIGGGSLIFNYLEDKYLSEEVYKELIKDFEKLFKK